MLTTLLFTLLQASLVLPTIAQLANYILLLVNAIYTIFIIPTYKEYKALVKDYNERVSPKYLAAVKEIKAKEKEDFKQIIDAIKDLKHTVNQMQQDKNNLTIVFDDLHEIRNEMINLKNKRN